MEFQKQSLSERILEEAAAAALAKKAEAEGYEKERLAILLGICSVAKKLFLLRVASSLLIYAFHSKSSKGNIGRIIRFKFSRASSTQLAPSDSANNSLSA